MKFKKYNSIENHYQQKHIDWWLEKYPELKNETYILQEKIHGANISIWFSPNKDYKVAKRNSFLNKDDKFYDIWNVLKQYKYELNIIQEFVNLKNYSLRLYGELFGGKIQKGINYGEEKQIRFFDLYIDDFFCTQNQLINFFINTWKIDHLLIPNIKIVNSLEEALNYNEIFDSQILEIENNKAEGIVIKPYLRIYKSPVGEIFYLKKKNPLFNEITKKPKVIVAMSDNIIKLKSEFMNYINDNRLQNIFSKEGEIQNKKDIGKYLKLFIEDAKKDFIKDNDLKDLDKIKLRYIYNVKSLPFKFLKKYL